MGYNQGYNGWRRQSYGPRAIWHQLLPQGCPCWRHLLLPHPRSRLSYRCCQDSHAARPCQIQPRSRRRLPSGDRGGRSHGSLHRPWPNCPRILLQGWFKFGGVELAKINFVRTLGEQKAFDNQTVIYLASAAMAEFVADIFLCPYEACRIRLVSDPTYATSMVGTAKRLIAENGVMGGFYSGFVPILFKQIPYPMAKFAVQGNAANAIYKSIGGDSATMSGAGNLAVSLSSGVIAGVAAAIISHPADTLLSKINKAGAGGSGSMMSRLGNIAAETGYMNLCTQGLPARCVMIGSLTAGQFGIFDIVLGAIGAKKFHFHAPEH